MKYTCIKQHDITDCAAACLATISRQYGLKLPISRIREIAGTDKMGTNAYGVVQAAEQLGFTAKGVKGDQNAFFSDFPLPCIAHVVTLEGLLHYVVIHKITRKQVVVADPAKGIVKYAPEDFFKLWTGVLILLVPNTTFEKRDETKGSLSRFFALLLPRRGLLLEIFFASLLITALGIGASFYFRFIMDDVVTGNLRGSLTVVSIGVIALYIFKGILEYFRNHLMLYLSQKLDIPLILGYYQHTLSLPMSFFGTRRVGEIVSRYADAGQIRSAISGAALTIMVDTLMAAVGGVVLYTQSSRLFFIAVLLLALYAVVVFAYNRPIRKANEKIMENNAQLTSYLVESLNGIQTVKAFNGEQTVQTETEFKFIRLLKSIFKLSCIGNAQEGLKAFVEAVGGVVILWVGAYSALQGHMTVGSLVAFNALLVYFLDPVKNLINLQPLLQTAMVASDRLGEILDLEIEKDEAQQRKVAPASLRGDISLQDISFRYGTRQLVLEHFCMDVKCGERIAIVGESGAGKTTIAKLLLNFYPYEAGTITVAGYALPDIQLDTLREKIAYIPQETFLFSGTIMENLTFGLEAPDMEEVFRCARMAQLHDFVNTLPLRYETHLDENGGNLSGGQRQRIAIARAMLKKPDILILDEATSNLDTVTERAIQETIDAYSAGMTTIIIAHRLSTIRRCDRIFVMEQGKIVEAGPHDELIAKENGFYRRLYQAQTGEQ